MRTLTALITLLLALLLACAPESAPVPGGEEAPPPAKPRADAGAARRTPMDAGGRLQDAGTPPPQDAGTPPLHDAGAPPRDAGTPPPGLDLSGVWAMMTVTSQLADAPFVGETQSLVTALSRMEIAQQGTQLALAGRVCAIEIPPTAGLTTVYPESAIAALPASQASLTLDAVEIGATYAVPPATETVGWTPDGPDDEIPTDPADPRIGDPDTDQNPGVTIQTTGLIDADLYIVNRSTVSLEGTIVSEDRIEGLNDTVAEQVILGATSGLVPTGPVDSRPDPDPNNSTFVMVRLLQGGDCTEIVADQDTLFP